MKRSLIIFIIILLSVAVGYFAKNPIDVFPRRESTDIVIVVMDAWAVFPWKMEDAQTAEDEIKIRTWIDWWENDVQDNIKTVMVPFLSWARENGVAIVFSNMVEVGWDSSLSPLVEQEKYNEPIINLTDDLDVFLKGKGINIIYYIGHATNNCILGKPTGMKAMAAIGYEVILVGDGSLSGEYQGLTNEEALAMAEDLGSITTSKEIMRLYGENK